MNLAPDTLAADAAGNWHGVPTVPVTGFAIDSRSVGAGEMFVALRTEKRDGHDFLAAALARGAAAALVARFDPAVTLPQLVVPDPLVALHTIARAQRARFAGPVVGITGSAGKTSTKDLLAVLLGEPGDVLATDGNLNNHLGVPLTLLRLDPARQHWAVVEAGISGPGEMDVLARLIEPDVAMITTVAPAHLDGLGSVAGVAVEKARLAAHRRAGGTAVFPAECLLYPEFRDISAPLIITVAAGTTVPVAPAGATLVSSAIRHAGDVTHLSLSWSGTVEEFSLRRVTTGMAGNAALALATAMHLGIPSDQLRERLPRWRPAALRGDVLHIGGRLVYLDCYNANPAAMADAVEAFVALAPADMPRLFVLGCMEELGANAPGLHRATAARWPLRAGDLLVVFGALAPEFAAGARDAAPGAEVRVNPERGDVARLVRDFPGAVFLKGSRRYALETLLPGAADAEHRGEVAA